MVNELKKLEPLKGAIRKKRLTKIYNQHKTIILGHFSSTAKLAQEEGIDHRVVSKTTYRDVEDVNYDLDAFEKRGIPLTYESLFEHNPALARRIQNTGWGRERIIKKDRAKQLKFPPCNPSSGLMHDRMIVYRRRFRISAKEATKRAGGSVDVWHDIEHQNAEGKKVRSKIEQLLDLNL